MPRLTITRPADEARADLLDALRALAEAKHGDSSDDVEDAASDLADEVCAIIGGPSWSDLLDDVDPDNEEN